MIRCLMIDGTIVGIRGSEEKHTRALQILIKCAPEDELSAENTDGERIVIRAGSIKHILDARGRPIGSATETLNTVLGSILEPSGKDGGKP